MYYIGDLYNQAKDKLGKAGNFVQNAANSANNIRQRAVAAQQSFQPKQQAFKNDYNIPQQGLQNIAQGRITNQGLLPQIAPQHQLGNINAPNFGNREDGSKKGMGYLGVLKRPNGNVSTELSVGVNFGGRYMAIPTLVPTLNHAEIRHLVNGGNITPAIIQKAVEHARQRMTIGKNPFAQQEDHNNLYPRY